MNTKLVTFSSVRAYGGAGGSDRGAIITIHLVGKADTVKSVEKLVAAAPTLLELLAYVRQKMDEETITGHFDYARLLKIDAVLERLTK